MGRATTRKRERDETRVRRAVDAAQDVSQGGTPKLRKGRVKPRNERQGDLISAIQVSTITFAIGSAGTGKTHVAVSLAIEMYLDGLVDRIILTRPAVEAGERLGYLPGDMREKIDPYLRPLYDVLFERLGGQVVNAMIRNGQIEICPLGFMRGRTFSNAVVVLDEGQNCTRNQLKMALTRLGDGSKMVVTGDPDRHQCDIDFADSGLASVADDLEGAPGIEIVRFSPEHVVRSDIVRVVLERI